MANSMHEWSIAWSKEGFLSKDHAKDVSRCIARAQEKYTGEKR